MGQFERCGSDWDSHPIDSVQLVFYCPNYSYYFKKTLCHYLCAPLVFRVAQLYRPVHKTRKKEAFQNYRCLFAHRALNKIVLSVRSGGERDRNARTGDIRPRLACCTRAPGILEC